MKVIQFSWAIIYHLIQYSFCRKSFYSSFQLAEELSKEEFVEYTGNIPHLSDFSFCYWEKLLRFNYRETSLFSFCTRNKTDVGMDCLQVWYNRDHSSMGRNLAYSVGFNTSVYGMVMMEEYRHRTWNQFCVIYKRTGVWRCVGRGEHFF